MSAYDVFRTGPIWPGLPVEAGEREEGIAAQGTGQVQQDAGAVETVTNPGYLWSETRVKLIFVSHQKHKTLQLCKISILSWLSFLKCNNLTKENCSVMHKR